MSVVLTAVQWDNLKAVDWVGWMDMKMVVMLVWKLVEMKDKRLAEKKVV